MSRTQPRGENAPSQSDPVREGSPAEVRRLLSAELVASAADSVEVKRDHAGLLLVRVVSDKWTAQPELEQRRKDVRTVLARAGLKLPPALMTLRAPSEIEGEADEERQRVPWLGTPNWADALLLEPQKSVPPDDRGFSCKVVAFWGVKGGVGRTTALAHVAALLGRRNAKVLALDLDLDSPGLVASLAESEPEGARPRFEDLVSQAADPQVSDADLKREIEKALRPAKERGIRAEVLGPAYADAPFVRSLLGPLSPAALYRGPTLRRLVRVAMLATSADLVLVDARSGYCDESAMAVLDLCDEVVIFASPTPSVFASLAPAIEALERSRLAIGRPRLCHFVAGMLPAGVEAQARIMSELPAVVYEARAKLTVAIETRPEELPPDVAPIRVHYSPRIVENDGTLLVGASDGYQELTERLLPMPSQPSIPSPSWLGEVLKEAVIPVPQAEDEGDPNKLYELYTSTPQLQQFVRHDTCLVLGAKGTGKSFLRRMCLEQLELLTRRSGVKALRDIRFVDGFSNPHHGRHSQPPITQELLREFEKKGENWSQVWSALALGRALHQLFDGNRAELAGFLTAQTPALPKSLRTQVEQLVHASSSAEVQGAATKLMSKPLVLDDLWPAIDRVCEQQGKSLVLLFDDLDLLLGESKSALSKRLELLRGLFDRMQASWLSRRWLGAKIFLREDLFRRLGLEEAAKYQTRTVTLLWRPDDIWRLAIRAIASASPTFTTWLDGRINLERLDDEPPEVWKPVLDVLWGDRMGEGDSQTRTTSWVENRLHDGRERMFPRALLWLLDQGIKERRRGGKKGELKVLLDPLALRAAMPTVSDQRLADLKAECTDDARKRIGWLKGFDAYQNRAAFLQQLEAQGDKHPEETLRMLAEDLGVIEHGARNDKTPTVRIVDLYAFAKELQIKRVGRR